MTFLGLGIGLTRRSSAAIDADAAAYFAAMSVQPDATRKGHLGTLITALKSGGIWTKLDWLTVHAAHDEQAARVNVKNPAQVATAPVAPTFTTDRGHAGNASSQYLDSGWAPTGATQFQTNSAHLGVWIRSAAASGTTALGNVRAFINPNQNNTQASVRTNNTSGFAAANGATAVGRTSWTRRGAAEVEVYKNGVTAGTSTIASLGALGFNFLICAYNNSGTPAGYSGDQISAAHWGAALSDAEDAAMHSALATYMTAVGA